MLWKVRKGSAGKRESVDPWAEGMACEVIEEAFFGAVIVGDTDALAEA